MRKDLLKKFCIGTAQFGSDYGIANQRGKVSAQEIEAILRYAFDNEIRTLDTAYSYGSEEVLGQVLKACCQCWEFAQERQQKNG